MRLLVASLPPGESFEVSVVAAHLVARAPAGGDADFVAKALVALANAAPAHEVRRLCGGCAARVFLRGLGTRTL